MRKPAVPAKRATRANGAPPATPGRALDGAAPASGPAPAGAPAGRPHPPSDPAVDALVREVVGRIADKWTMQVLETLAEQGRLRFTRLAALVTGISQKMLTATLRRMEADGLVVRTVHPVVPPRVDYALTPLGLSLGEAFCGVWLWAERHREAVEAARAAFHERAAGRAALATPAPGVPLEPTR